MIISHHHKFIFVAIPKTGTHSIRRALRPELSKFDWEQCNLYEKRAFPQEHIKRLTHGHLTIAQAKSLFLPPIWNQFSSFCFMRDPIDRFLSFMYFVNSDNDKMSKDALGEVQKVLKKEYVFRDHILLRPQSEFVTIDSQLSVDFIGRTEHLKEDFQTITQRLFESPFAVNQDNRSQKEKIQLPTEIIQELKKIYKDDYQLMQKLDLVNKPYVKALNKQ